MDARLRQSERAVATHDGDRVVVVHLDTSELVVLEGVSGLLWEALAPGETVDGVVDGVIGPAPDGDEGALRQRVRADVEEFASDLRRLGLLEAETG